MMSSSFAVAVLLCVAACVIAVLTQWIDIRSFRRNDQHQKETSGESKMNVMSLLDLLDTDDVGLLYALKVRGINSSKVLLHVVENQDVNVNLGGNSNLSLNVKIDGDVDSNTGKLFKGDRFREISLNRLFTKGWQKKIHRRGDANKKIGTFTCNSWAVVTTIFEPSEAIRRLRDMDATWCLLIVADTKTPSNYLQTLRDSPNDNSISSATVKFFSLEDQKAWESNSAIGAFVREIPFRHFARKNIGFLFAIYHGAEFIFDFDDDNIVNLKSDGVPVAIVPTPQDLENVSIVNLGDRRVFNPYPLLEASLPDSWPRGFPLEAIQDIASRGNVNSTTKLLLDGIAVIQYLADGNPDVDAIHRMTKKIPMTFAPESNFLLVPKHTLVPYNAQATVHTKAAHWATLLPVTVPGRVTDIWRSYFSEIMFRAIGLAVVFGPPRVVQERNAHNILADMNAELDLYFRSGSLIQFLDEWKGSGDNIPERMENLWIDLFERGYIEENDIKMVQLWLLALIEAGYDFPALKEPKAEPKARVFPLNQT